MAKVLVVDDSPMVFKMIKRALEPSGFIIVGHAENGKIGLEMYDLYQPDIVTLDVTMPVMDGIEMAKNLFSVHPDAKVVMLSAMGDDELIESAKNLGVKQFATKPVNTAELISAINAML